MQNNSCSDIWEKFLYFREIFFYIWIT